MGSRGGSSQGDCSPVHLSLSGDQQTGSERTTHATPDVAHKSPRGWAERIRNKLATARFNSPRASERIRNHLVTKHFHIALHDWILMLIEILVAAWTILGYLETCPNNRRFGWPAAVFDFAAWVCCVWLSFGKSPAPTDSHESMLCVNPILKAYWRAWLGLRLVIWSAGGISLFKCLDKEVEDVIFGASIGAACVGLLSPPVAVGIKWWWHQGESQIGVTAQGHV